MNDFLSVNLQDDYKMIPNFDLSPSEMDIWRKTKSAQLSQEKYQMKINLLERCIEQNILPPWSLSMERWNMDFTEQEQEKFLALERSNAVNRMNILSTMLLLY